MIDDTNDDDRPLTYRQIAAIMGKSPEWVRQTEQRALRKLAKLIVARRQRGATDL